jgi:hypothetical protein
MNRKLIMVMDMPRLRLVSGTDEAPRCVIVRMPTSP